MKPLILAFIMLINCQGTENKNYDVYDDRQEEIELIINDFVENIVQVAGAYNRLRFTFIGINDEGDLFIEEDVDVSYSEDDFLDELLEG